MDFITKEGIKCYHCGEFCNDLHISAGDKAFCCTGCKLVFEILDESRLCEYYELESTPGISQKKTAATLGPRYDYLDDPHTISRLIDFTDGKITSVNFYIPAIHCSSCIWLLENLHKLRTGIIYSEVNFLQKTLLVKFKANENSLKELVELLVSIGYEPKISLNDVEQKTKYASNKKLYYKIGIAGFCFGNIMLLSFPEYLAFGGLEITYKQIFGYLNILLGLPVILYSASDYFKSAYTGLKQKKINIDFPICLGLSVLFIRSVFEIVTHSGAGFIDSMTGLIFFLLVGRIFQSKTYDLLNFERNYKSYFPISVTVKKNGTEASVPVTKLNAGDRIIVRNNELIPADAILFTPQANIDYSFVTGESIPANKVAGEIIYAGGRQIGSAIELEVIRTVSKSYLTSLWNKDTFTKKDEDKFNSLVNVVGKYFTILILLIAASAFIYWLPVSIKNAVNAFTAVLIIACPCGIALTNPFALGNALRIFGRNKFYVKNTSVIERMSNIDTVVFDKTGTITQTNNSKITFTGCVLSSYEQKLVKSLARNSTHPLSAKVYDAIGETDLFTVTSFRESVGKGIEGYADHRRIRLGSALYTADNFNLLKYSSMTLPKNNTLIFLSINGHIKGYFTVNNCYRSGMDEVINRLDKKFEVTLISGDNNNEEENLLKYFHNNEKLRFNQSPENKLDYIKNLQNEGKKVLMIGDGLNDAGALKQSNAGIAVSEDITNFSPACDVIMDASVFVKLPKFLNMAKATKRIIITSFVISIVYNIIGVTIAFNAVVSPMIAAILMPLSSITVVLFTVISTNLAAKMKGML